MTTLSWSTTKTSDSYTPAVLLLPGKPPRRCTVLRVRLDTVEAAREKLAAGRAAWVSVEDGERVTSGTQNSVQR